MNLSTTPPRPAQFAATSGGATVTSVSLPANTASVTAYYGDTKAGTPDHHGSGHGPDLGHPGRDHHGRRPPDS